MLPAVVTEKLEALPVSSGVYLFKDKKGNVVYVGKAKSLRSRVKSYFQESGSDARYFIPILRKLVRDLETVRRPSPDGARYFGPYHSATSARRTLHLVNKHFQLRTCTDSDMASRKRPCLQHQIKR